MNIDKRLPASINVPSKDSLDISKILKKKKTPNYFKKRLRLLRRDFKV